jgi:hypothetical protein
MLSDVQSSLKSKPESDNARSESHILRSLADANVLQLMEININEFEREQEHEKGEELLCPTLLRKETKRKRVDDSDTSMGVLPYTSSKVSDEPEIAVDAKGSRGSNECMPSPRLLDTNVEDSSPMIPSSGTAGIHYSSLSPSTASHSSLIHNNDASEEVHMETLEAVWRTVDRLENTQQRLRRGTETPNHFESRSPGHGKSH